ncbi:MAG: hypothetical protein LBI42_00765, partial [Chitinispirillales bacterium]|nr:hypothetical protein [Chitinispirillales bacterium]
FKQKGPRQIHYLGLGRFKEPSLKGINDSKELMKHWKKQGVNKVGVSDEERKHRRAESRKRREELLNEN